jgi:hypothetical protein
MRRASALAHATWKDGADLPRVGQFVIRRCLSALDLSRHPARKTERLPLSSSRLTIERCLTATVAGTTPTPPIPGLERRSHALAHRFHLTSRPGSQK